MAQERGTGWLKTTETHVSLAVNKAIIARASTLWIIKSVETDLGYRES